MNRNSAPRRTELLAPAGDLAAFVGAVEAGADAVYIGAPGFNARALAREFSLADIAAMLAYARQRGVKLYLAMNSLMREEEIPRAVELLAALEALAVDALIIQDLGVYALARRFFPALRLHASTLLRAANRLAVSRFGELGFARVVLARELSLAEIAAIGKERSVEIEVFVHGAMCFSVSGLCLFSSYLGGKSGLRGRCVQPCRRRYRWRQGRGERQGYLFSMNDLCGIELLDQLRAAGVDSLKIEGRMRSARYVRKVVAAYRLALDAAPGDRSAMAEARQLLDQALARKSGPGYFLSPRPTQAISAGHSGNVGRFVGRVEGVRQGLAVVRLRCPLQPGDRLRLHAEQSGDRIGFSLRELRRGRKTLPGADVGEQVTLGIPAVARPGDSLYLVDVAARREKGRDRDARALFRKRPAAPRLNRRFLSGVMQQLDQEADDRGGASVRPRRGRPHRGMPPWWLKIDDLRLLPQRLAVPPDRLVVALTPRSFGQWRRKGRGLKGYRDRLTWALPPVVFEEELPRLRQAVKTLLRAGYRSWQLNHPAQFGLLAEAGRPGPGRPRSTGRTASGKGARPDSWHLVGGYPLNVLNSQAARWLRQQGLAELEAAIEIDRELLGRLCRQAGGPVGLTVYGRPPLFTARLVDSSLPYGRSLVSPRNEVLELDNRDGRTIALARERFSLLPHLPELARLGVAYVVVDLCGGWARQGELETVVRKLGTPVKGERASRFNFAGRLG